MVSIRPVRPPSVPSLIHLRRSLRSASFALWFLRLVVLAVTGNIQGDRVVLDSAPQLVGARTVPTLTGVSIRVVLDSAPQHDYSRWAGACGPEKSERRLSSDPLPLPAVRQ